MNKEELNLSEMLFNRDERLLDIIKELREENKRLNNIIKEKDNTLEEVRKMLYKRDLDDYDIYTANVLCDIQSEFEEILRGEDNENKN